MTTSREAFDLRNSACLKNFRRKMKQGYWKHPWFWKLVFDDTRLRVCSHPEVK